MSASGLTHSYTAKLREILENIIQVRAGVLLCGGPTLNEKANEMARLAAEGLLLLDESRPTGPGMPDSGSVGPWKECVYKHPDAPKVGPSEHDLSKLRRYDMEDVGYTESCVVMSESIGGAYVKHEDVMRLLATTRGNK